jgi:hypothetical protein
MLAVGAGIQTAAAQGATAPGYTKRVTTPEERAALRRERASARAAKAQKEASCRREARAKRFGIHLVQRHRFMKECMARA